MELEEQGWHGILGVEGITTHSITLDGNQHLRLKLSPLLSATGLRPLAPQGSGVRGQGSGWRVEELRGSGSGGGRGKV